MSATNLSIEHSVQNTKTIQEYHLMLAIIKAFLHKRENIKVYERNYLTHPTDGELMIHAFLSHDFCFFLNINLLKEVVDATFSVNTLELEVIGHDLLRQFQANPNFSFETKQGYLAIQFEYYLKKEPQYIFLLK